MAQAAESKEDLVPAPTTALGGKGQAPHLASVAAAPAQASLHPDAACSRLAAPLTQEVRLVAHGAAYTLGDGLST